jgi:hypothetical protein
VAAAPAYTAEIAKAFFMVKLLVPIPRFMAQRATA